MKFLWASAAFIFLFCWCLSGAEALKYKKKITFNIGGLLPDTLLLNQIEKNSSRSDVNVHNCQYDQLSILKAIKFATQKLSYLFEQFYGCYIQLSPADTHVIKNLRNI